MKVATDLLRNSIKIGVSGIVYDSAPPIRVGNCLK